MIKTNQLLLNEIQKMNIHIRQFAVADLDTGWQGTPHTIKNDLFYLMLEGEAEIWCNGEHIRMTPGNIYVIPAGTVYGSGCPDHFKKMYFYGNLLNSNRENLAISAPGCIILTDRTEQIQKMLALYQNNDYLSAYTLRVMAEQLVLEVMQRTNQTAPIVTYSQTVRHVIRRIIKGPHMSLTASLLAKELNISPSHLHNQFSKEVGIPVGKYVRAKVLAAAEEDLKKENLSINDIAEKYGFCDQFYFSRLFTKQYGISPSKFRKENII